MSGKIWLPQESSSYGEPSCFDGEPLLRPVLLPTGDSPPVQFRLHLAVRSLDRFTGIEADVLIPGYG